MIRQRGDPGKSLCYQPAFLTKAAAIPVSFLIHISSSHALRGRLEFVQRAAHFLSNACRLCDFAI